MKRAEGLERILIAETNVSDLLQLFMSEDPAPMSEWLGVRFDEVSREASVGTSNRADLLLSQASQPVAAVEVKVGHSFSDDQRENYESWAKQQESPLLVLASLDAAPGDLGPWVHVPLGTLFGLWRDSDSPFLAELATRASTVLERWSSVIAGVSAPLSNAESRTYADIDHSTLLRVVSRELRLLQRARGYESKAFNSSGGNTPIVQSWSPVPGVDGVWFIADARLEGARVHLRFGVDGEAGTATSVWKTAKSLDDAITLDSLTKFLEMHRDQSLHTLARFEKAGTGRPRAKGDWEAAIAAGQLQGANPGYLRDGFTRLECGGRIAAPHVNNWSLDLLMAAVHEHLGEAWAAVAI